MTEATSLNPTPSVPSVLIPAALGTVLLSIAVAIQLSASEPLLMAAVAAVVALAAGLISLFSCNGDGFIQEDPFHLMNLLLSIGLLSFGLADAARSLVAFNPGAEFMLSYFSTGASSISLLLWLVGVIGYTRSASDVLSFARIRLLLIVVFCVAISAVSTGVVVVSGVSISIFRGIWIACYSVGVSIVLAGAASQTIILRHGIMGRPMFLLFLGAIFMFVESILKWQDGLLLLGFCFAALGYLFVGTSIIYCQHLECEVEED